MTLCIFINLVEKGDAFTNVGIAQEYFYQGLEITMPSLFSQGVG